MTPGNQPADRLSMALVFGTVVGGAALVAAAAVVLLLMTTHL
jgi:hypothetical protein